MSGLKDLAGKTAVVTGASAGIGRALARKFALEGMNVVWADIDMAGAEAAAQQLGTPAVGARTDVTKLDDVRRLADLAYERFGAVDLLCNNAGVLGRVLPSWQQPIENWRWVFDVNVQGVIHGIQAFTPRMLAQDSEAYIVNTGSIAGLITGPFFAPYNASKHAVVALSECLHHELRALDAKVRVAALCPGWVNTGLATIEEKLPADLRAVNEGVERDPRVAAREQAVRRMVAESIQPEAIADMVLEAVREDRFYIFPHPERKADIERRLRDILEDRIPEFPPKK